MGKRCICQICTCGRHKCPHRPHSYGEPSGPCLLTEYKNSYIPQPYARQMPMKPTQDMHVSEAPISDVTTHKSDYITHPLERPARHQATEWKPAPGVMDTATSYKTEFTPKYGERVQMVRPEMGQRRVGAKFIGEPTYKNDYRAWELPEHSRPKGNNEYHAPTVPFEGQATYVHDYQPHPLDRVKPIKPADMARGSEAPFDDSTDYKSTYIKHDLQPREARLRDRYTPPAIPFDGLTSHQRDYVPLPLGKVESMKPKQAANLSNVPLDDQTTSHTDYIAWPMERQQQKQRQEWIKPTGEMESATTHKMDFTQHPLERPVRGRPPSRTRKLDAPFCGETNYKHDFQQLPLSERPKPMARDDYHAPTAPFQGTSNYTTSYIQHPLEQQKRFGPTRDVSKSDAPFDDRTNYKMEYTKKELDICPAVEIDKRRIHCFTHEDPQGHRFYEPCEDQLRSGGMSPQYAPYPAVVGGSRG